MRAAEAGAPAGTVRAGTVDVPAGTFDNPNALIKPGERRVAADIMDFNEMTGRSSGRIYLPGYADDVDGDIAIHQERPGGPWKVDGLPGNGPGELSARDPHALLVKVAQLYGITGTVSVDDERRDSGWSGAPYKLGKSYGGKRDIPAAAPAAPERAPRTEAFNSARATGGNLPPRREGETDGMYQVRIASSDDQAERLLNGYSLAGLKAMAQDAKIPGARSMSKAALVQALMGPRRRYWDSIAIERQ